MTTDIAELVKTLREQPEWAETLRAILLTREVLELPDKLAQQTEINKLAAEQLAQLTARVDQLTARVEEFIVQQAETNKLVAEQLAQLTARVDQLTVQMARLTARVEEFIVQQTETNKRVDERLDRLTARVEELTVQMAQLNARLDEFIAEQREINKRLAEQAARHEADIAELKTDMTSVKAILRRMDGRIGRLEGADLERKIHANIAATLGARREFRHPRVLKSIVVSPVPALFNLLYAAQDDGRIDQAQVNSLLQTDIILSVRDRQAQLNYVAVEISRTVYDYDLTRARERADILAAASAAPVLALVVGYIVPPPQRRKAEELGVQLLESANFVAAEDNFVAAATAEAAEE